MSIQLRLCFIPPSFAPQPLNGLTRDMVVPAFAKAAINCLSRPSKGLFIPDRLQQYSTTMVVYASEMASTWKQMKPALKMLMTGFAPMSFRFTGRSQELWEENPMRYCIEIIGQDYTTVSSRMGTQYLIIALLEQRGKVVAPLVLEWLISQFKATKAMPTNAAQADRLTSLLSYFASTADHFVLHSKKYQSGVGPLLQNYVIPCMNHPAPYVRVHALQAFFKFARFDWKKDVLERGVDTVLKSLEDKLMPVRFAAVLALQDIIASGQGAELLRGKAARLVSVVFDSMKKMPINDSVVSTLVIVVQRFAEELQDKAVPLVRHMLDSFKRYFVRSSSEDSDDPDADRAELSAG